jgi:hypothetical protein
MYLFIAFYKGKSIEISAPTSYAAQTMAAAKFKAKKAYEITVMRADIEHNADF